MRHRKSGTILDRKAGPRKALVMNLAQSVILFEKVTTTSAKAKVIRPVVEKLVTRAGDPTLANRRFLLSFFGQRDLAVKKLLEILGPRYKDRKGGYTRIVKIGRRKGDGGEMVQINFV